MSIEQRLRSGLAANANEVSAPVEAHLDRVLLRRRRRVRNRVALVTAAVVAGAVIVPTSVTRLGDRPQVTAAPSLAGSYRVEVDGRGPTRAMDGTWEVTIDGRGLIELTPPSSYDGPPVDDSGDYQVSDDEITTNLLLGWPGCQLAQPAVGTYSVVVADGGLRFDPVRDTCPGRLRIFTSRWERLP